VPQSDAEQAGLLKGKTAIVTGAAHGIGRAIAVGYAREGADVVIGDVDDNAEQTVKVIEQLGGRAIFIRADVTRPEDHIGLVETAVKTFGKLDVACNNAGISGEFHPVTEMPIDNWHKVIATNLTAVFYAVRAQIPAMIAAGGGAIVNIASVAGQVAIDNLPHYIAAKHGVVGLTKSVAVDYGPMGIRVNSVGPAFIRTRLLDNLSPDVRAAVAGLHAVKRLGEPEEVSELVTWLSSDRASFITGAYFPADGGYLAR
jgi:NAD(P)-dependent dehydrogenase (short-subunit alcohol dehydrogenase family)